MTVAELKAILEPLKEDYEIIGLFADGDNPEDALTFGFNKAEEVEAQHTTYLIITEY